MTEQPVRKLAVILYADVIGSTVLVQKDESRAHARIVYAFNHSPNPSKLTEALSPLNGDDGYDWTLTCLRRSLHLLQYQPQPDHN